MKKGILAMLVLLIGAPTVADASSYVCLLYTSDAADEATIV